LQQQLDGAETPPEWSARRSLSGAFFIKTERIQPDPAQPRQTLDQASLEELTNSVRTHGILQPITVRHMPEEGMYQIIAGERRYLAATAAGLTELPCWVQTPNDQDILVQQVVENWQRADLHPFDLADTLVRLRDQRARSQKQLAELTGKPESEISRILSLLKLNPSIQVQCRTDVTGRISRRHLEALAKLPEGEQLVVHAQVRSEKLTAQETEQVVQEKLEEHRGERRRGAPVGTKRKFITPKATVVIAFRRKTVALEDVIEALDAAKRQAKEEEI
jgi:ParB family transcriptional regulator, chromosome partitioning protein